MSYLFIERKKNTTTMFNNRQHDEWDICHCGCKLDIGGQC